MNRIIFLILKKPIGIQVLFMAPQSCVSRSEARRLGKAFGSNWYLPTCTYGSIHSGWVEPASQRAKHYDVSWAVSTPRSPVPASLHLLALQLKPSLSGLGAPKHPFFPPSILVLIQMMRRGCNGSEVDRKRCGVYTTVYWTIL